MAERDQCTRKFVVARSRRTRHEKPKAYRVADSRASPESQALMFLTPPLQGLALKRPVAYAAAEFCLAELKAV